MFLRSTLFNMMFYPGVAVYGIVMLPCIFHPRSARWAMVLWVDISLWLLRHIAALDYQIINQTGSELPQSGSIFASKHQSAWETLALWKLVPNATFILKRELFWLPVVGWWLWRAGNIGIIRGGGSATLRDMNAKAKQALANGHTNIIIFPQGTRVQAGEHKPYRYGVAALAKETAAPIIPVTLNAGEYWPRLSYLKRSGTISIVFLPIIRETQDTKQFLEVLEKAIEGYRF